MRKFFWLIILGTLISLFAVDTTSAIGRRRRQCCQPPPCQPAATETALAAAAKVKVFTSPKGATHRIIHTGEFFASRERKAGEAIALTAKTFVNDDFQGTQRMAAKTSIAKAKMETFATVEDLLFTLPPDVKMMKHKPKISKAADSDRVKEEMRNVTVTAHLYAASREDDNDFHLIIGGDPDDESRLYMNVEVSGLPPDEPFRSALAVPRKQFKDFFGDNLPGRGYSRFDPPIAVRVSGSLFYDISHAPGVVGPSDHKPASSWEIHPVTNIEFLGQPNALKREPRPIIVFFFQDQLVRR